MRSRKAIISLNFHVVSMWSSGNGMRLGKNALRARCSRTDESLPIEYIITGRSKLAATSRKISMLSASRVCKWVNELLCTLCQTPPHDPGTRAVQAQLVGWRAETIKRKRAGNAGGFGLGA